MSIPMRASTSSVVGRKEKVKCDSRKYGGQPGLATHQAVPAALTFGLRRAEGTPPSCAKSNHGDTDFPGSTMGERPIARSYTSFHNGE